MASIYDKYMRDKKFRRLMAKEDFLMKITETFCKILEKIKCWRNNGRTQSRNIPD
jgi:hypothetical protein